MFEVYQRKPKYPCCDSCGDEITSEYRWVIDGNYYCDDCVDMFRESNDPIEGDDDYEV